MKVLVVSGFLGAGKTTFIRELSRRTGRDFAVMENEYGPVGVDGAVLSQDEATRELQIFELTEGCICCSMKSDFATSVLTIANTVDPEVLIVEPTGVGMLSRVLENLSQIQYEKIVLLAPITLVDGQSFDRSLAEYPEILQDQLTSASAVLISKMESASLEERSALEEKIRSIAPEVPILSEHYSHQLDAWWQKLLTTGRTGPLPQVPENDSELENLGLTDIRLESADQLLLLLNGVVSGVFGEICRAKGVLRAGEGWLRFDAVGGRYSITGCDRVEESRAVFIGRSIHRGWLREYLQQDLRIDSVTRTDRASSRRMRQTKLPNVIPSI